MEIEIGELSARFEIPVTDEQVRQAVELIEGVVGYELPEWQRERVSEALQMLSADNVRRQMEREQRALKRRLRVDHALRGRGSDFTIACIINEFEDDDATLY